MSEQGMESAEQRVKARWPDAFVGHGVNGDTLEPQDYRIMSSAAGDANKYGVLSDYNCETPEAAWEDAASRLEPAPAQMTDEQAVKAERPDVKLRLGNHEWLVISREGVIGRGDLRPKAWADARRRLASTGAETKGMQNANQDAIRVVRPVDGCVLGSQDAELVPLAITDDRNSDPLYASILDMLPDEMPVPQHHTSGYMRAEGAGEELLPCGHRLSEMLTSVETEEQLFCGRCDHAQMQADRVTEEFLSEKEQQITSLRAERDLHHRASAENYRLLNEAEATRDAYKAALEDAAHDAEGLVAGLIDASSSNTRLIGSMREKVVYQLMCARLIKRTIDAALSRDDAGAGMEAKNEQ